MDSSVKVPVIRLGKVKVRQETGRLHIQKGTRTKNCKQQKDGPKIKAACFSVSGRTLPKGKNSSTTKVLVEDSCNSETVHHYFPNKKKTAPNEASATKSQETKSGSLVTSGKRARSPKNTKCPVCTRRMLAKNYDEHLKLHSENCLDYKCLEDSCGAQFQYFHRMKAHFINKHKKFIVGDGKGGYKVRAERGKKTAKSPTPVRTDSCGQEKHNAGFAAVDVELPCQVHDANKAANATQSMSSAHRLSSLSPSRICFLNALQSGTQHLRHYNNTVALGTKSSFLEVTPETGVTFQNTGTEPMGAAVLGTIENVVCPLVENSSQMHTDETQLSSDNSSRIEELVPVINLNLLQNAASQGSASSGNGNASITTGSSRTHCQPSDDGHATSKNKRDSPAEHPVSDADQLVNPPAACIKEDPDFVADRVIKEEENPDDSSIELVLPDHDTVIHLPNVRSNRNKHGYSVSFEGQQVIIKRRGVGKQFATPVTTTRKTDCSKFTETIVIDDEKESASVVQID